MRIQRKEINYTLLILLVVIGHSTIYYLVMIEYRSHLNIHL